MVERIVTGFLNTNTYIYSQWKKGCIIIDPGGSFDDIITQLQKKNFTPLAIVLTHGHYDHLAAVGKLTGYFGEKDVHVPVYIHEADARFLGATAKDSHMQNFKTLGVEYDPLLHGELTDLPEPEGYLSEGDTLLDTDIEVIHTPGHTPGGVSLFSQRDLILFSGDALFFEGVGRTDLPDGDMQQLIDAIREKLFVLPDETRVFPGHGPFSTIEREKQHNPFAAGRTSL